MTKIFEDVKGGSVNVSLKGGTKIVRKFIISEISGNRPDIIPNAVFASGVPKVGDIHPTVEFQICTSITTEVIGAVEVAVNVTYSSAEFAVDEEAQVHITISGTVQSVVTNEFFVSGEKQLMILEYEYPADEDPEGTAIAKKIVPTASKEQALIVVTLRRLESKTPLNKAAKFVDKTNSKTFLGTGKKTWLCTSINGVSSDGGKTYEVTYVFEYRREDWDVVLAFTDKDTGLIPIDVEDQPEAKKKFQLQDTLDFGNLNLEEFE